MKTKLLGMLAGAAAIGMLIASPASATPIFSDDFNRADNNTVGNSWVEIGQDADDVAVVSNMLLLRDNNSNDAISASVTRVISTLGFNNITLSFDWAALEPSDQGDTLFAEWRTGNSAWTVATGGINLATLDLGGSTTLASSGVLNLGAGADNLAALEIRFRTLVSNGTPGDTEGAILDNVLVSGTAITEVPPTAVPEPLTLSLFGAGLAGMAGMRRRVKKNA